MAAGIAFILNDQEVDTALPDGTALVDFIRADQRLTGTRVGCREGDCGACTVLLGTPAGGRVRYRAVVSCLFPLADAAGRHVVTVEGLNPEAPNASGLTPVQQAFVSEGASQCGFCTPGLVVSLTAFLLEDPGLESDDAVTAIEGNVCRCTGYVSIRRAVERLLRELRPPLLGASARLPALIGLGVVPAYFAGIAARLRAQQPQALVRKNAVAVAMAGGTDLYVQRGPELAAQELRLLSRQEGFAAIWPAADRIHIGAAAPISDLMESRLLTAALPQLPGFLRLVSSTQIRNRATVGGNIVNASPIGDLSVMLLALDAAIGLRSLRPGGRIRQMKLRDFFLGYKKLDLRPGEVVAWLSIPLPGNGSRFHFEKVARRRHQDIASVNTAIGLDCDNDRIVTAHVAAGGVAPVPLFLKKAAAFLAGREVSSSVVREFITVAESEIAPISDVRGAAAYKKALLRRLLFAHFLELFPGRLGAGDLP
jgi:xanthine dehydrogenase small subunit